MKLFRTLSIRLFAKQVRIFILTIFSSLCLTIPLSSWAGNTLDVIKQKKVLRCGMNAGLIGFAAPNSKGNWQGIDADFCRAVAAAILGSSGKVQFVPSTTQNRFTLLQTGEVDMLSRNTTWSASRDSTLGAVFAGTIFYDGQGFMVRKTANVTNAKQLNGATLCVMPGTTTELNASDWFRKNKITYKSVVISELSQVEQALFSGRCDAFTSDRSGLAVIRKKAPKPDHFIILPEIISKEPLGPLVRKDDWEFFTLVKWVLHGLVEAEEYGITSANVEKLRNNSKDPQIQRILGVTGDIGKGLNVDNAWLVNVIKTVGNYGEMYERNIAPLGLERGLNALPQNGGLLYAPPVR